MSLSNQVGKNINPILIPPNPVIKISCHVATCIWLFREVYNKVNLSDEDILKLTDKNPTAIVKAIALAGMKRVKPPKGYFGASAGAVLVFWDGEPRHSCVVYNGAGELGGYNQKGWFVGGADHDYSHHNLSALKWGSGVHVNQVQAYNDQWYSVYTTFENSAKQKFKQLYDG